MLFMETCRKTEVGKLDVSTTIQQDVVRLDVTVE